jgi:N4-gp56 family major capsid protein
MPVNSYGTISTRTNLYAADQMLEHAKPVMVLEKLAQSKQMPKNKTDTIKFRRPRVFDAATTPLVEGVTPSSSVFGYDDVSTSLTQYGMVIEVTDKIEDLHEDPVLRDATMMCGENIGRTMEALDYGVVRGGTNVFYANGTQRTDVNTEITTLKQRAVIRALKAQKAEKITSILGGSSDYGTLPVEAAYVGVTHTDMESDIRNMSGFKSVSEYGTRSVLSPHEIGSVEDVRYILSADLGPFENGGGSTSTMISTGGSLADVYPVMYFGKNSWAKVALRGAGAISPTIIPVGQKTKDDPLGQRGYVGWKTWWAALILNQLWMCRLEVASTDL